ncbi:MAG: response regulator [Chlorobiales bacterium]|nr:response regulator [Chlorobiales bacterium]
MKTKSSKAQESSAEKPKSSKKTVTAESKPNSSVIRLMLVDDDDRIRESFSRSLSLIGYEVETAANGEEAIKKYNDFQPEIVLLDIRMPGMDGFAVLEKIRKRSPNAEVIFITGYGDMNLVIDAMRAGATDFVAKPLQMELLTSVLENARNRLEDQKNKPADDKEPKPVKQFVDTSLAASKEPETPVQINAFGTIFLRVGDKMVFDKDWPNPKTLSVFKILLINHRKTITIDEFIDLLWPETRRESAEVMLFTAISFIRHFFEPELKSGRQSRYVINRGNGYEMNLGVHHKDYTYDVELFQKFCKEAKDTGNDEKFEAAIALYSDDFLKTDGFEDWSSYQREQLKDQYLDALESLSETCLESGNFEKAIAHANKMLNTDKLYEPAYELLIKTYLKQELVSKAARVLKQCVSAFEKELGMPVPERIKQLLPTAER